MKQIVCTLLSTLVVSVCAAQEYSFKELNQTDIKGASRLTAPKFVKAGKTNMYVEKFGHAAPALYDWDKDGKLDMLVGEFGSGSKANILVFKNLGSNKKPKYAEKGFYATDVKGDNLFIGGS